MTMLNPKGSFTHSFRDMHQASLLFKQVTKSRAEQSNRQGMDRSHHIEGTHKPTLNCNPNGANHFNRKEQGTRPLKLCAQAS